MFRAGPATPRQKELRHCSEKPRHSRPTMNFTEYMCTSTSPKIQISTRGVGTSIAYVQKEQMPRLRDHKTVSVSSSGHCLGVSGSERAHLWQHNFCTTLGTRTSTICSSCGRVKKVHRDAKLFGLFNRVLSSEAFAEVMSDHHGERPKPASTAFSCPEAEFRLAVCVQVNSCKAPRRNGWKTRQPEDVPYGGFGPDLPCYPPMSHGSFRFAVHERRTQGSELPTGGSLGRRRQFILTRKSSSKMKTTNTFEICDSPPLYLASLKKKVHHTWHGITRPSPTRPGPAHAKARHHTLHSTAERQQKRRTAHGPQRQPQPQPQPHTTPTTTHSNPEPRRLSLFFPCRSVFVFSFCFEHLCFLF